MGTAFTMEQDFYRGRLTDKFGIEVVVPEPDDRKIVHDIIYQELCKGEIKPESRSLYLTIIDKLKKRCGCRSGYPGLYRDCHAGTVTAYRHTTI